MTKEEYEAKQQAKRDRYAARAAKKRSESHAAYAAQRAIADRIPPGQPILVGHHSERRHRRDLARIDRDARKSVEAANAAAYLERKAQTYGTHAISADDPSAIGKLQSQLTKLEAQRAAAKPINAAVRRAVKAAEKRGEKADHHAIIAALDAPEWAKTGLTNVARAFSWTPQLDVKNLGANIRRIKKRIAELEATAQREPTPDFIGNGFRITEAKDDNRVRVYFDERPSKEVCRAMKREGFRWAPSVGAWQRQLNAAGVRAARQVAQYLMEQLDGQS